MLWCFYTNMFTIYARYTVWHIPFLPHYFFNTFEILLLKVALRLVLMFAWATSGLFVWLLKYKNLISDRQMIGIYTSLLLEWIWKRKNNTISIFLQVIAAKSTGKHTYLRQKRKNKSGTESAAPKNSRSKFNTYVKLFCFLESVPNERSSICTIDPPDWQETQSSQSSTQDRSPLQTETNLTDDSSVSLT